MKTEHSFEGESPNTKKKLNYAAVLTIVVGVMVSIVVFQAADRGSIFSTVI